jgi:hypothetical protein
VTPEEAARSAFAASLRAQILDRVKSQEQLVGVAAVLGGAATAFGGDWLRSHAEVLMLLGLFFVSLALAILRADVEIATIALHLSDSEAFGPEAAAQRRWEVVKYRAQGGIVRRGSTAAQVAGSYAIPLLAYLACVIGAFTESHMNGTAWVLLTVSIVLVFLFVAGARDVVRRHGTLGRQADG